jgi:cytochrome c peroxidase
MALVLAGQSTAAEDLSRFHRQTLLESFDSNHNEQLDPRERRALRRAFGGIDIPMLPSRSFDYTTLHLPGHLNKAQLDEADNTPDDNPLTDQGATLGRVLFYDRQLSRNNTVACASCHHQRTGFADPRRRSVGFEGGQTARNAMGLANLRYSRVRGGDPGFFWDERVPSLEAQVLTPIQDKLEMGMTLPEVELRLASLPYYPPLFEAAYGSPEVTSERIAGAVSDFLRSMVSLDSRYDRAVAGEIVLPEQEQLGRSLFINGIDEIGEFGCAHCHVPPTFNMPLAMNNGLDLKYRDRGLGSLSRPTNDPFTPTNDGKFKAPSLRNVDFTSPYMHDGRFKTLEQVVEHYSAGVQPHENVSLAFEHEGEGASASGFRFTSRQKAALVAFLRTLTDNQFLTDPRFSDPFVRRQQRLRR